MDFSLGDLGFAGDIINAGIGVYDYISGTSSKRQHENNKELMKMQQDWNKMMSDTEVQRRVKDMEKAGINPILAAGSGAASGGGGGGGGANLQPPQQTDLAGKAASAAEYKRQKAETKNLQSVTEQNESATAKNYADIQNNAEITKAQVNVLLKEAGYKQAEIEFYNKWGVFPGATKNYNANASVLYGLGSAGASITEPIGYKNNNNLKTSAKKTIKKISEKFKNLF